MLSRTWHSVVKIPDETRMLNNFEVAPMCSNPAVLANTGIPSSATSDEEEATVCPALHCTGTLHIQHISDISGDKKHRRQATAPHDPASPVRPVL
jgi:hypothetical protein